jgi:hypothetical protein
MEMEAGIPRASEAEALPLCCAERRRARRRCQSEVPERDTDVVDMAQLPLGWAGRAEASEVGKRKLAKPTA